MKSEELLPHHVFPAVDYLRVSLTVSSESKRDQFPGVLRFVSPEVSPVDGRVRIWAEIENPDLLLRPGVRGSLAIGGQSGKR